MEVGAEIRVKKAIEELKRRYESADDLEKTKQLEKRIERLNNAI